MRPRVFWVLALVGVPLLAVPLLYAFDFDPHCGSCWAFNSHRHNRGERYPIVMLKTITSAQSDFRANDRDGDGVNQFWRADIAGLYALAPEGGPQIRLIEQVLALADDRPLYEIGERRPYAGYWFRSIPHSGEKKIDAESRFAAMCRPADYPRSGKFTFIVDENNTIYWADLGHGQGVGVFPTDEELKAKWVKID
jgi:hypothetical protein